MRSLSSAFVAGTCALLLSPLVAKADPVLGFSGGSLYTININATIGYEFQTGQAITVTALDAFDASALGLSTYDHPSEVFLYNAQGTVLASATLSTSDSTESGGNYTFYTTSITAVDLAANTDYFIAEDISANNTVFAQATSSTGEYGVSFVTGVGIFGFGNQPTSNIDIGGLVEDGSITADFDATPTVAPTPEPSSLALLSTGVLSLGAMVRRRIRRG